jgi:tetraacyldisaccharide 4'-kinase
MQAPSFWQSRTPLSTALLPLAALFEAGGCVRRALTRPYRAPVPVICVGNLVAGGAGKTPVALALAALLRERSVAVYMLTRGYGGRLAGPERVDLERHTADDVGDEALLLSAAAPTWVARDRVAGAKAAVDGGAELILMDDGMQNPSLEKDVSLIVVDAGYGFGNGRVIPAGPLRERMAPGQVRADAAIVVGGSSDWSFPGLNLPLIRAEFRPVGDPKCWQGTKLLAFAGIGRPEKFFDTLQASGAELVAALGFPDHHRYSDEELDMLTRQAAELRTPLVTTEKDWVRLPPSRQSQIMSFRVQLEWCSDSDRERIEKLVGNLIARRS